MGPKKFYKKKTSFKSANYSTSIGNTSYLVIVESPSKCQKIEGYLGSQYKCIASKGHIRELVGLKSIATRSNFDPTFTIIKEKASHVKWMKEIIVQYPKQSVFIASDDDREGEGIGWHICMCFGLPIENTKRILFHEITQKALLEAVRNPTTLNMDLVKAQHARQVLDMVVGFKISPHLWKHVRGGRDNALSAGRCQTPALRLVFDREQEIAKNPVEMKYKITGTFTAQNIDFGLSKEMEEEGVVKTFLEMSKTFPHELEMKAMKKSVKQPPRPFHTSHLLQTASNVLHMSPKRTMQVAQILYQNGLITYMRTENNKYAPPFLETMKSYILETYDAAHLGNLEKVTNRDAKNPHEAIRVTNIQIRGNELSSSEKSLYQLIWRNTLESCMSEALYKVFPLEITAPEVNSVSYSYKHNLELPEFLGWKAVKGDRNDDEALYLYLKTLCGSEGKAQVPYQKITGQLVARNKVGHYSESSLVQKLEDLGIGRPSTFAMLVETIQERDYVKLGNIEGKSVEANTYTLTKTKLQTKKEIKQLGNETNKLSIQPVGILALEFLLQHFGSLFSYDYTKHMEDELDKIAQGNTANPWYELCKSCYKEIGIMSKALGKVEKEAYKIDDLHEISFQQYGPCIKKTENGEIRYLPIKENMEINLERARNGEYSLEELLAFEKEGLGMYNNEPLKLKKGRYGPFLENGSTNYSLKEYKGDISCITLTQAIEFIESISKKTQSDVTPLNENMSIRQGKYGPYIYYKTESMKKPQFFSLKKYDFLEKSNEEIIQWVQEKYLA